MNKELVESRQPRTGAWLLFFVAGFVLLQILNREPERQPPGLERGDLVLQRHDLPDEILGWHCLGFKPALPSEKLPDGQFWWTHFWNYRQQSLDALVAFDQADWTSWHELTVCYQAIGWTLVDREVISTTDNVSVVLASLEKPTHEKAKLVFSLFAQDGSLIPSPLMGMPLTQKARTDQSFAKMLNGRLAYERPEGTKEALNAETVERVLQCQVFVRHAEPLSEVQVQHVIELHLETLDHFRTAWLNRQPSR